MFRRLHLFGSIVVVALVAACSADLRDTSARYSVAKNWCTKQRDCAVAGYEDLNFCSVAIAEDLDKYKSKVGSSVSSEMLKAMQTCANAIKELSCGQKPGTVLECQLLGGPALAVLDRKPGESPQCAPGGGRCDYNDRFDNKRTDGVIYSCPEGTRVTNCANRFGSDYCCDPAVVPIFN